MPEGTVLPIALSTFMNSRSSTVGDSFYAETVYPVWIQQRLAIPRGSLVKGNGDTGFPAGQGPGQGTHGDPHRLGPAAQRGTRPLIASFRGLHGPGNEKMDEKKENIEMDSSKGTDTGQVVGTAGEGAIIGAIAGGGSGAGIGAGAGAAAGLARSCSPAGVSSSWNPGPSSTSN